MLCVQGISRCHRLAFFANGTICTIEKYINAEGDDCDLIDDALTIVFQLPDGGWSHALIHDLSCPTAH